MAVEEVSIFRGAAKAWPPTKYPVPTSPVDFREADDEPEPKFWEREFPAELEAMLDKERAPDCHFNCPPNVQCRACQLKPGPAREGWEAFWPDAPGTYPAPNPIVYDRGKVYSREQWLALGNRDDPPAGFVEFDPEIHVPLRWPEMAERVKAPAYSLGKSLDTFLSESTEGIAYVVADLIVEGGAYAIVGRPETFKSFGATHLGFAAAGAATEWMGRTLGPARPFLYISNEKSPTTVRERFRRQTADAYPTEEVVVIHRAGVTFGNAEAWAGVVEVVRRLARPLAVIDTLASLAGLGFDENSGKDMAIVLGRVRELVDNGATVLLCHHPSKHGEGNGGARMRGHTSLWGDVDGVLEFTRPDRAVDAGLIRAEPKDGEFALIPFRWNRDTFLLEADETQRFLTAQVIAEVVREIYRETPLTAETIAARFPGHGRTTFRDRLSEAVDLGLIARQNKGPATRYVPGISADDTAAEGWK